jgi:hypothetical protein
MLVPEATYPYPGSYALLNDLDLPFPQPTELVRIMWRRVDAAGRCFVAVSFPMRDGASGNKEVAAEQLIDGTPLTAEEGREFHDLDRALDDRNPRNFSKRQRTKAERRDALKQRMLWAPFLTERLRDMRQHADHRKAA